MEGECPAILCQKIRNKLLMFLQEILSVTSMRTHSDICTYLKGSSENIYKRTWSPHLTVLTPYHIFFPGRSQIHTIPSTILHLTLQKYHRSTSISVLTGSTSAVRGHQSHHCQNHKPTRYGSTMAACNQQNIHTEVKQNQYMGQSS